jgi:hypothetical protein
MAWLGYTAGQSGQAHSLGLLVDTAADGHWRCSVLGMTWAVRSSHATCALTLSPPCVSPYSKQLASIIRPSLKVRDIWVANLQNILSQYRCIAPL